MTSNLDYMNDNDYIVHWLKLSKNVPRMNKLMQGAGFFDNLKKAWHVIKRPVQIGATLSGQPEIALGIEAADAISGSGHYDISGSGNNDIPVGKFIHDYVSGGMCNDEKHILGGGKKIKRRRRKTGPTAYNLFVSKFMKETGLNFRDAVKKIKQNNLYKKNLNLLYK